jgi:hypothetical protein
MPTRAWLLGVRLGWIMAVEGDRLVASWTGLGASGAGAPSRGVKREAERTRFARLIDQPGRGLGGPAVHAACGASPRLA